MVFDTSGKGDMYTIDDIASPLILYSEDLTELNDSSTLSNILGDRNPETITTVCFPNLTDIGNNSNSFFENYGSLEKVILPSCITIGDFTFANCQNLKYLYAPKVTNIGSNTFTGCISLFFINLPLCISLGDSAFENCFSLISINLLEATNIGSKTFYKCTSLNSINLSKIKNIGTNAFYGCTSLTSVSLPLCTDISNYAFYGCTSLTSVDLPEVISIGSYAFYECTSLTSVDLPKVTSISNYAFRFCTSLKLINITNSSQVCSLSSTYGVPNTCYIQVPSDLLSSYKSATNWNSIASRIVTSGTYDFSIPSSPERVEMLNAIYPIGSVYMSVSNKSPASSLGGSWTRLTNSVLTEVYMWQRTL